ncbi:MAG: DUF1580 domain-containing protein [Planctomycetales bacterium]|nr:DUF1580 domain-containing protein [Planctomycetales bacterium]
MDLRSEELFPFNELPKRLQQVTGSRKRINISTAHRWRQRGVKGVRLESVVIGGERFTSYEAISRFADASTIARDKSRGESIRVGRLSAQRERDIENAERELDAAGIKGGAK